MLGLEGTGLGAPVDTELMELGASVNTTLVGGVVPAQQVLAQRNPISALNEHCNGVAYVIQNPSSATFEPQVGL